MVKFFAKSSAITQYFKNPYFGFVNSLEYIPNFEISKIHNLLELDNHIIQDQFEENFSKLIGDGNSVSFGAGRMGFYALLKILKIRRGDEIIILGSTCSVMINIILRCNATPIYSDINTITFGSDPLSINKKISNKTKMIIAQHSFGIPCDIENIKNIASKNKIFLLEDCALTLGSKINNKTCGNFGDAALFSTDHTKLLNTLTGGLIYTKNKSLHKQLKISQNEALPLSNIKKKMLLRQFLFEHKYYNPKNYAKTRLLSAFKKRLEPSYNPFLNDEFGTKKISNYPFPSKLPIFLSYIGLLEVENWELNIKNRLKISKVLVSTLSNILGHNKFKIFSDNKRDIIPHRLVLTVTKEQKESLDINRFIDTSYTWFENPIVATSEPLENFQYYKGTCPISENIGEKIINIPCNFNINFIDVMNKNLSKSFNKIKYI